VGNDLPNRRGLANADGLFLHKITHKSAATLVVKQRLTITSGELHCFFNMVSHQPPVNRIAYREADDYGNLHREPKHLACRCKSMTENQKDRDGHPSVHTNLPGGQGKRVGLQGSPETSLEGHVLQGKRGSSDPSAK
jgi:hypothetical protein